MSDTNVMAVYNGGTSWTRNTNCIVSSTSGYDTTGICLNIAGIGNEGATLISNRHVLLSKHVSDTFTLPQTVYFVNNSNTTFTYTITSVQGIGSSSGTGYTDISIGYLNTTVDASLTYYKVFPSNFLNYLQLGTSSPNFQEITPYLPAFYVSSGKKFLCGDIDGLTTYFLSTDTGVYYPRLVYSSVTNRYNNSEALVGGDSGNAIFCPVNNEIVLLGANATTSGMSKSVGNVIGTSSYLVSHISAINSAMTTLAGTSYSLTEADLSSFYVY